MVVAITSVCICMYIHKYVRMWLMKLLEINLNVLMTFLYANDHSSCGVISNSQFYKLQIRAKDLSSNFI